MKSMYKLDGVEVRKAPGKGRGVFATRAFKKDEAVEISPVVAMTNGDGEIAACTKLGEYTFNIGSDTSDGCAMALGYAALYNHSAKGENCLYTLSESVIVVTALRDIKKGEELLFNYGWDNDTLAERGIEPDQEDDEDDII